LATFDAKGELPNTTKEFKDPVPLADLELGKARPRPRGPRPKPKPKPTQRTALIPPTCRINPQPPRINAIYNELLSLSVDTHPNATAVLLRVFVELSVDHFIAQNALTVKDSAKLFEKLRLVAQHLRTAGKIPEQLKKAVDRIAGTKHTIIGASTVTFNQYVHNAYVYPKPTELFAAWDELQPFLEKVWE